MQITLSLRKALLAAFALAAVGACLGAAANRFTKPKSILHVVTLYYKDGTTEDQKKDVVEGVEKMAAEIPGIKSVWLKGVKVQGSRQEKAADGTVKTRPFTDAFVLEFETEAAFKAYEEHPAHRAWAEKTYLPLRGYSYTHDITNP
ncbi:MAG: Dabb family protein [Acidobacteria bacterium]|nr:Dabb family protein [Acidobacteriota bacterium]